MIQDRDEEVSKHYKTDDYTFSRITNKKVKRGTADQYKYTTEHKLIHGVMVPVKVYAGIAVNNSMMGDALRSLRSDLDTLELLELNLTEGEYDGDGETPREIIPIGESEEDA